MNTVFTGRPIGRITDVTNIKPVRNNEKKHGGSKKSFDEMFRQQQEARSAGNKNNTGISYNARNNVRTAHSTAPSAHGFMSYYTMHAQTAYFCMTNSLTDAKA